MINCIWIERCWEVVIVVSVRFSDGIRGAVGMAFFVLEIWSVVGDTGDDGVEVWGLRLSVSTRKGKPKSTKVVLTTTFIYPMSYLCIWIPPGKAE